MGGLSLLHLPRWMCGLLAGGVSLFFLYQGRGELPIVFASLFLFSICVTDTLYSKIPNLLILLLLLGGFIYHALQAGPAGLLTAFLGLLTGFALLLIPYMMGGMGAGDVKALAALGSLLGAGSILQVFLYMALIGGLMSVLHYAFNRNLFEKCRELLNALKLFLYTRNYGELKPNSQSESLRFPYAAAIAFGYFAYMRWGDLI